MKSGGGSAPSAVGNSLAIAERQKPAPSCVAALFQMFAKRKLFSSSSKKSKLLPPVRAQKFTPGKPPGGGEKTPPSKTRLLLLDSADYSRSKIQGDGTSLYPQPGQDRNCSENEMCTPGVVARLMGLSSMPDVSHQRPTKATYSSEFSEHRNSGPEDWSTSSRNIYTSPQKQQKTGQLKDHNTSQFNAPDTRQLWPRKHAQKVASPIKSPRSMSSRNKARLIEAAAKVLEPGLQSKNRRLSWRHAYLEYPCGSGDGAPGATVALHNLSDQFLRDMCDVDAPRLSSDNIGGTYLHNSNQWTKEDTSKNCAPVKRLDQHMSCQMQPEGNGKCLLVSSSEKAGCGDNVQRTSNCIAGRSHDVRKNQRRNTSRESTPLGPLKQNNLKQNALPDPEYMFQRNKHTSGEQIVTNTAQDYVALNRKMNGSTSLRSKRKVMDRFGDSHTGAENKNMSTKGRQTNNLHSNSSNKLKLKTEKPKNIEKDMIIAKGAGLVSEKPRPANPNCARSDVQRQPVSRNVSRGNKKSGIVSFTSSSPMKVAPTLPTETGTADQGSSVSTSAKKQSQRYCQSTSKKELFSREVSQGISSMETTESVFFSQDELKNRGIPSGRATSSLPQKRSSVPVTEESLSADLLWQSSSMDNVAYGFRDPSELVQLPEAHKKHEGDAKSSNPSPCITRSHNKRSSISTIQSSYADDAFISGTPLNTAEIGFTDSHPVDRCTAPYSIQDESTKRNSRRAKPNVGQHGLQPSEPAVHDSKPIHSGEITTTVELLLANVRSSSEHKPKESSKAFLLRTIESSLATLTGTKLDSDTIKAKETSSLRNLALDFVLEYLDSMCWQLCDNRSFSKLALICTEVRLAAEVRKEIARCSDMAGKGLDDLAVSEVEVAVAAGMTTTLEAFQIGLQIEQDLVQELVNEIGLDMFRRL